jgi:hypothetical protein
MSLSEKTPVEIDTELAVLYQQETVARNKHERIQHSLHESLLRREQGLPCYTPYDEDDEATAYQELHAIIDRELPFEAEYERRPWQRYWHVTNVNGHIHTSMGCSSCQPTTQYAWRTDLSGLTEQEVVEREAYNACTICMPIAPAEQKAARERYNAEQKAQRAAERDAKKQAKAEKAQARAAKLVDKVEAAIEKMGGRDAFRNDYSLYGKDGRKSVYDFNFDLPVPVGDVLYEMKQRQEEGRSHHSMNEYVRNELTKRGLI